MHVPSVTLALDDDLLVTARKYAARHGATLNGLIRQMLEKTVRPSSAAWVDELDKLCDELAGDSKGARWTRGELHQRSNRPRGRR